jgi:Skp family chaperone for outer membrane proteins
MNAGMISFLILLAVLFFILIGIIYIIMYIRKKDETRVTPLELTDEFKKAEKNITNGILDLHSAKIHQDISRALLLFHSGAVFFREHNLEFEGKRIKDVEKLIEKFSMEKLNEIYQELESELTGEYADSDSKAKELHEKIMALKSDDTDEYKKIKQEIKEEGEERDRRKQVEKDRQKIYNKLIKEDIDAMEKKILDEILRDNNITVPK